MYAYAHVCMSVCVGGVPVRNAIKARMKSASSQKCCGKRVKYFSA